MSLVKTGRSSSHGVAQALAERLAQKAKRRIAGAGATTGEIRVLSIEGGDTRTIHVFDDAGAPEITKQIAKALVNGESILVGGRSYWMEISPVFGTGSGHLEWHSDGNRIRKSVDICVKFRGRVKRVSVGYFWGKYE